MYYSIFIDNSFKEFEQIDQAIKVIPEFIIELRHRGTYDQTFEERRVVDDHYYISFYNPDGTKFVFQQNGWKILEIDDPVRYNTHIRVQIADPIGDIRIFDKFNTDCHYPILFRNTISDVDGLIRLYRYFHEISIPTSWKAIEKDKYESKEPASLCGLGNIHKYYYDVNLKIQPNIDQNDQSRNHQSNYRPNWHRQTNRHRHR